MSEKKKDPTNGQEPEENQSTETEAQTGGLQEDDENQPDDVLEETDPKNQAEEPMSEDQILMKALTGFEDRLKSFAGSQAGFRLLAEDLVKRTEVLESTSEEHADEIGDLKLKLSDERIIAIARGLEKFLFRCEDTNSAMQATLDSQPIWWQKEIWRFLAITTMIAWLLVGVALSVPDLRIEIGRSLISQREQMMIEVAEEAWRQDEARREAEEAGRGER